MTIKLKLGKREQNLQVLINAFGKYKQLQVNEIMDLLNINRQSVYNYLKLLENKGYILNTTSSGHSVVYSISSYNHDLSEYESIDNEVLRTFSIIKSLQSKPQTRIDLRKEFNIQGSKSSFEDDELYIDLGRTQFDKLIANLVDNGIIVENQNNHKLFASGELVPITIELEEQDMWKLYNQLEMVPNGSPYHKELVSIYKKCSTLLGNIESEDNSFIHVFGRKYITFAKINYQLQRLNLAKCFSNIVKLSYKKNDKSKIISKVLAAGSIVYSVEKDELYLIGVQATTSGRIFEDIMCSPFKVHQITSIEVLPYKHTVWKSVIFQKMLTDMFSISTEKTIKVKVEFDKVLKIPMKLERLHSHRPNSRLIPLNNDKIIYEDEISGLSDFANYLRQFGKNCKVLEPAKLRNIMKHSIERTLERYKEAGYEQ